MLRDTARYPPLMRATAQGRKARARSLRALALEHLGLVIQAGEHSPIDDARAALYLYHQHRKVCLFAYSVHVQDGYCWHIMALA